MFENFNLTVETWIIPLATSGGSGGGQDMWQGATMDVGQDGYFIGHRREATARRKDQSHAGRIR